MAIGAVRCECGGRLNEMQVFHRIISRLNDLDEENFRLIGALQVLGADRCDHCGQWVKVHWHWGDRCWCLDCLQFDPAGPITEDDEVKECKEIAYSVVKFLLGLGKTVNTHDCLIKKAYLQIHKQA